MVSDEDFDKCAVIVLFSMLSHRQIKILGLKVGPATTWLAVGYAEAWRGTI